MLSWDDIDKAALSKLSRPLKDNFLVDIFSIPVPGNLDWQSIHQSYSERQVTTKGVRVSGQ